MTANSLKPSQGWQIETSRNDEGIPIRFAYFSKSQAPEHILVFINGRSEWIEKYSFLPEILELPEKCAFVTLDHRGQGASGGQRGDIDHYNTYVDDISHILGQIGGDLPYSILAHSMGGLIALYGTMRKDFAPKTLVLSSPLMGFPQSEAVTRILKPLIKFAQGTPVAKMHFGMQGSQSLPFEENPYTHDADHYALLANAPYRVPQPTFNWIWATLKAIEEIFNPDLLARLKTPVLLLAGTKESIVNNEAFGQWIEAAGKHSKANISYRQTTGAKHELFNEIAKLRKTSVLSTRFFMPEIWGERGLGID